MILDRLMLFLGALMFGGVVLAHAMKPTGSIDGGAPAINLAAIVPQQFGNWRLDTTSTPIAVSPELDALQKEVYGQMLVGTYINQNAERIMLTIAYGGSQSRELQVHRPEVCYAALGFQLLSQRKTTIANLTGASPIRRCKWSLPRASGMSR